MGRPRNETPTRVLSARVPEPLADRVVAAAARCGMTPGAWITACLADITSTSLDALKEKP